MDDSGNGCTGENIRDFPFRRGRRQPVDSPPVDKRLQRAQAQHGAAHQRGSRAPARKGARMKAALLSMVLWTWWALVLGTWLRLVWEAFLFWGPV